MPEETVLYEDPRVKITSARAVIEGKTYPIANLASVGMTTQNPSGCLPGGLILVGIASLLIGLSTLFDSRAWDNNYNALVFGILMLVGGIAAQRASKPTYILSLSTSAGEIKALQSADQPYIQKLTDALNQAIVQRG